MSQQQRTQRKRKYFLFYLKKKKTLFGQFIDAQRTVHSTRFDGTAIVLFAFVSVNMVQIRALNQQFNIFDTQFNMCL